MLRMTQIGAFVLSGSLAACASAPVSTSESADVPASRVQNSALLSPRPGTQALVIKRDSGFVGAGCNVAVYVDGAAVAELAASEKVTVHLAPGQHFLGARHNCMGTLAELQTKVEPGSPRTFRIGTGMNGDFSLQPTAF